MHIQFDIQFHTRFQLVQQCIQISTRINSSSVYTYILVCFIRNVSNIQQSVVSTEWPAIISLQVFQVLDEKLTFSFILGEAVDNDPPQIESLSSP